MKPPNKLGVLLVFSILFCLPHARALAQDISISSGGSLSLGTGQLDLDCGDLSVDGTMNLGTGSISKVRNITLSGTLNGDAGSITFGNNWDNSGGGFNSGSSQVTLNDDCGDGTSAIGGNTVFNNFTSSTTGGKALTFEAGTSQTVQNALVLTGAPGNLMLIRSSATGSFADLFLAESGSQVIDYLDVNDMRAPHAGQYIAPGLAELFNSRDGGDNDRWFKTFPPIPALSTFGLLLMIVVLLLISGSYYRRQLG